MSPASPTSPLGPTFPTGPRFPVNEKIVDLVVCEARAKTYQVVQLDLANQGHLALLENPSASSQHLSNVDEFVRKIAPARLSMKISLSP